jgi:hypothetical protein
VAVTKVKTAGKEKQYSNEKEEIKDHLVSECSKEESKNFILRDCLHRKPA